MRWAAVWFWLPFKPFAALDFRAARGDFGARLAGLIGALRGGLSGGGYCVADHQVHDLMPEDVAECVWLAVNLPSRAVVEEILIRPRGV